MYEYNTPFHPIAEQHESLEEESSVAGRLIEEEVKHRRIPRRESVENERVRILKPLSRPIRNK